MSSCDEKVWGVGPGGGGGGPGVSTVSTELGGAAMT